MYNFQKRIKLDPKFKKCIFLRYVDNIKRYHLWDPTTNKVVVSSATTELENEKKSKGFEKKKLSL